jgi:hypothetical protein
MGIDRIGKGDPAAPPSPDAETEHAGEPLERLKAGRIDLEGYLDLKVAEATAHLNALRAEELNALRRVLRDELSNDPALAALVERATGQRPQPKG